MTGNISYAYLPAGNLSAVTSLAGTVAYSYDEAERLTNITASSALASYRFALAYSQTNGLLDTMTCTNTGLSVAYEFDNMDRLTNIVWRNGTSNLVRRFTYSYNSSSMITNRVMTDDGGGREKPPTPWTNLID